MTSLTDETTSSLQVIRTVCRNCHGGCGVFVTVQDGKAVDIAGDFSCPTNLGYLCPKGRASISYTNSPERVIYPMRRVGDRGSGSWKRITWEAALDLVEEKCRSTIRDYGPEYIAKACGTGREWNNFGNRFFNALGAVLNVGRSPLCYFIRVAVARSTLGTKIPVGDYYGWGEQYPNCVMIWGNDPLTSADGMIGNRLTPTLKAGAKIITIDPVESRWARRADCWLQIRPVTDGALALGMLHVILTEGLYDRRFVERWTNAPFLCRADTGELLDVGRGAPAYLVWDTETNGPCSPERARRPALTGTYDVGGLSVRPAWELLLERVREYPPERVAEICWVASGTIVEAARLFATTKPAVIQWGNALDVQGVNSSQAIQAVLLLMAVTGNLDVPGGMAIWEHGPFVDPFGPEHERPDLLPEKSREMLADYGAREFPILGITHGSLVNEAVVSGRLPAQVLFVIGHNFLLTAESTETCRQVLQKIPFSVTFDLFMTPTAALSDLFLPVTTWLERDQLATPYTRFGQFARVKAVEPPGECRTDEDILLELAQRLDLHEAFPWETVEEYFDWRLARTGKSFQDLRTEGQYIHPQHYRKFETDYFRKGQGFPTPTGRVELYQTTFLKHGHDPLPHYVEPEEESPHNAALAEKYSFLATARRTPQFFHSEHHHVPELRERNPDPLVEMNRATAEEMGIDDGDWVWIETPRGRIRQKAKLIDGIHPRVICNQHAWWYPERPGPDYGVWDSNLNVITRNDRGQGFDPIYGAPQLRGFLCNVYRAEGAP